MKAGRAEIDQQYFLQVLCGFQIVDGLTFFAARKGRNGFNLDENGIKTDEVHAVATGKRVAFVEDRQGRFAAMWDMAGRQLDCQGFVIDGFKKS